MNRTLAIFICTCTITAVVLTGGVVGSSFGLSVNNSVETPERTVNHDVIGEHTVNAVGVSEPDSSFTVSVTAPADETHFLDLYKGEDRMDSFRISDGDETVTIDTDQLDPGSYMLRLQSDGNTKDIFPVVINGYDIDVEATENTSSDELKVDATVKPTASSGQPHTVETVVWNDENDERDTLSSTGGDSYEGTVSLSAFDDDSYNVYVAALSDETVYDDRNEILAIDDSIVDDTDSDENTNSDDGNTETGSDDEADETDDMDDADDEDDDTEETDEHDDMDDADDEDDDTEETHELDDVENETTDNDSVIQPNTGSDESTTDGNRDVQTDDTAGDNLTDDETPLSPMVAIIALVSSALLAARRR